MPALAEGDSFIVSPGYTDMCAMPIRSETTKNKHHKNKKIKNVKVQVNQASNVQM